MTQFTEKQSRGAVAHTALMTLDALESRGLMCDVDLHQLLMVLDVRPDLAVPVGSLLKSLARFANAARIEQMVTVEVYTLE